MPDDRSDRLPLSAREPAAPSWGGILWRSWQAVEAKNIFLAAGGVSYSVLIALFPGLASVVSIYGLLLDRAQVEAQVAALSGVLPEQSQQLVADELHQLASAPGSALGISAVAAVVLTLWSASRGLSGMMSALTLAYGETDRRGFLKFNFVALCLTITAIIGGVVAIALVAVLPAVVQFIDRGTKPTWQILILQWPLLVVLSLGGLAVVYRYGPYRPQPRWRWISPGAIVATILWLLISAAFTAYVSHFASYNRTYGSLGGAVITLTWLYFAAFAVLFGAVINAEAELSPHPLGGSGDGERLRQ